MTGREPTLGEEGRSACQVWGRTCIRVLLRWRISLPLGSKLPGPGESFEMKMGLLGLSHRESWNEILIDRVGGRERKEEEGEGGG